MRYARSEKEQRRRVAVPRKRCHRPNGGNCRGQNSVVVGPLFTRHVSFTLRMPTGQAPPNLQRSTRSTLLFFNSLAFVHERVSLPFLQDTLVAIRVTLPEKDEDTDEPSPAETLQMAVRPSPTC